MRNGEDPDECAYFGKPPLMLAAFEGQVQVVDTLLRLGADPNVRSRTGGSSLVAAIMRIEPKNEACIYCIRATASFVRLGRFFIRWEFDFFT